MYSLVRDTQKVYNLVFAREGTDASGYLGVFASVVWLG
jgi:hypothetical protein